MRLLRRTLAMLIGAIAVCTAGLIATAHADPPLGAISGTITDAVGAPIANEGVYVQDSSSDGYAYGGWACTAADGSYTVSSLPSDRYTVTIGPNSTCPGAPLGYISQQLSATVSAPATTTQVNAALAPAAVISGTVTDRLSGAPASAVWVQVATDSGGEVAEVCTDGAGHYAAGGLPSGTYTVQFAFETRDCSYNAGPGLFIQAWYPGVSTFAQAGRVTATAGATTSGIDAALDRDPDTASAVISGTVYNRATGLPASGVAVSAATSVGGRDSPVSCTSATGRYLLQGFGSGKYLVSFASESDTPCGASYLPQYYKDLDAPLEFVGPQLEHVAQPTAVPATVGTDTDDIDAHLAPTATVSGTLTDGATGLPAPKVVVELYDSAGNEVGFGCTQADGTYTTTPVPAGHYRVGFASDTSLYGLCLTFTNTYLPTYYPSTPLLASATPVTVTAPANLTGINGTVTVGAHFSGTVATPGRPDDVGSPHVQVIDATGQTVADVNVLADDSYTVGGLEPGRYLIRFLSEGYEDQYYAGTPVAASAMPLTFTSGQSRAGINATLVPDSDLGSIRGTVTDATTRRPISGVDVAVATQGGTLEGEAVTGPTGAYVISGVPAGSYEVALSDPRRRYQPEYYRDSATPEHATDVPVQAKRATGGIDMVMTRLAAARAAAVLTPARVTATRGVVGIDLACPGTARCSGRIALTARPSQPFAVRTGHVARIRFRLSRSTVAALARRHRAAATVTVRTGRRVSRYGLTILRRS